MKITLIKIGKTQADLIREIIVRYKEKISPAEFTAIMGGFQQGNKADRIRAEVETIIEEWK